MIATEADPPPFTHRYCLGKLQHARTQGELLVGDHTGQALLEERCVFRELYPAPGRIT